METAIFILVILVIIQWLAIGGQNNTIRDLKEELEKLKKSNERKIYKADIKKKKKKH